MSESRPVFPIYALIVAAVAGGGTLLMEQPFRSTRPAEQTDINLGVTGTYDVPARLWQDPLSASLVEFRRRQKAAVPVCTGDNDESSVKTLKTEKPAGEITSQCLLEDLWTQIESRQAASRPGPGTNSEDAPPTILILPALVREGYYQADIENRRRQRYAVLTALLSQRLVPDKNRFIGHLLIPRAEDRPEDLEDGLIPYEWLGRDASTHVLLLWVPESATYGGAQELLGKIACPRRDGQCENEDLLPVAIIGPATSERLIQIAGEALASAVVPPPAAPTTADENTPGLEPAAPSADDDDTDPAPARGEPSVRLTPAQRALFSNAEAYLDRGVPSSLRNQVAGCMTLRSYANLRECLESLPIVDSDRRWALSTIIPTMLDAGYPDLPTDADDRVDVLEWALFSAANAYLDAALFTLDRQRLGNHLRKAYAGAKSDKPVTALAQTLLRDPSQPGQRTLADLLLASLLETQERDMSGLDYVWLSIVGDAAISVLVTRSDGTLSPTGCGFVASVIGGSPDETADTCARVNASQHLLDADRRFNALMVLLIANGYLDEGLPLVATDTSGTASGDDARNAIRKFTGCVAEAQSSDFAAPPTEAVDNERAVDDALTLYGDVNSHSEAAIAQCLEDSYRNVQDSDTRWAETVAALSAPGVTKAYLQRLAAASEGENPPPSALLALLISDITNYLDAPPAARDPYLIASVTCVGKHLEGLVADPAQVSACLAENLEDVDDSDPDWSQSIAQSWSGALTRIETVSAKSQLDPREWLASRPETTADAAARAAEPDTPAVPAADSAEAIVQTIEAAATGQVSSEPRASVQAIRPFLVSPVASVSALRVVESLRRVPAVREALSQLQQDRCLEHTEPSPRTEESARRLLRSLLTGNYSCGARRGGFFEEYVQTLSDDSAVSVLLREELGSRGVDAFDCRHGRPAMDSVALVGELDRAFAQEWVAEMMEASRRAQIHSDQNTCAQISKFSARRLNRGLPRYCRNDVACVIRFNYLEGLDGAKPEARKSKSGETDKSPLAVTTVDPELLARPVGNSQFDYLRRLADEVRREHRRLRRAGGSGIRAIGIFGGDFYDKLLILQALRQEMPNAIYFTNDLDARFLHPANYVWTRNVIVASAYGLTVGPTGCREQVPPFRDSYQSSTYVATLHALRRTGLATVESLCQRDAQGNEAAVVVSSDGPPGDSGEKRTGSLLRAIDQWADPPAPRLFEVSRRGELDITPTTNTDVVNSSTTYWVHGNVGSTAPSILSFLPIYLSIGIFILIIALVTGSMATKGRWHIAETVTSVGGYIQHAWRSARTRNRAEASETPGEESAQGTTSASDEDADGSHAGLVFLLALNLATYVCLAVIAFWKEVVTYGTGFLHDWLASTAAERFAEAVVQSPQALTALALIPTALTLAVWVAIVKVGRHQRGVTPFVVGFILATNIVFTFGLYYFASTKSPFFEPAVWFGGVSGWPSELLRMTAAIIGIFGLIATYRSLDKGLRKLCKEFFNEIPAVDADFRKRWRFGNWGLASDLEDDDRSKRLTDDIAEYLHFSRGSRRAGRAAAIGVIHFFAIGLLFMYFGPPPAPVRGEWARAADLYLLFTFVPITIFTAMFVVDATELCDRMVSVVANSRVQANFHPDKLAAARKELGLGARIGADSIQDVLRIDFIARHTRPVSRLIILPFSLIALLVVSRSTLFDQWTWNVPLVVAVLSLAGYALVSAVRLRRAAEEARSEVRARLTAAHRATLGGDADAAKPEEIESVMAVVDGERRGAFNSWFRNPIFQALLLPFGGAGAVALLEFLI